MQRLKQQTKQKTFFSLFLLSWWSAQLPKNLSPTSPSSHPGLSIIPPPPPTLLCSSIVTVKIDDDVHCFHRHSERLILVRSSLTTRACVFMAGREPKPTLSHVYFSVFHQCTTRGTLFGLWLLICHFRVRQQGFPRLALSSPTYVSRFVFP